MRALIVSIFVILTLAACGRNAADGPQFGVPTIGQAEMRVTPANPLVLPPSTALPPPAPGMGNRADAR